MDKEVNSLANIWANRRREDPELGIVYVFTEAALQVFAEKIMEKTIAKEMLNPMVKKTLDEHYEQKWAHRFD